MKFLGTDEIREILRKHELWLKGDKRGEQADFHNCSFAEEDLSGINLSHVSFGDANLFDVNFEGADLYNACSFAYNGCY